MCPYGLLPGKLPGNSCPIDDAGVTRQLFTLYTVLCSVYCVHYCKQYGLRFRMCNSVQCNTSDVQVRFEASDEHSKMPKFRTHRLSARALLSHNFFNEKAIFTVAKLLKALLLFVIASSDLPANLLLVARAAGSLAISNGTAIMSVTIP